MAASLHVANSLPLRYIFQSAKTIGSFHTMPQVRATDDTFCIAVLGDFLGDGSSAPAGEDATWAPRRATPDSVMNLVGLRPRIRIALGPGGVGEELEFTGLQDFDPGEIFRKLSLFGPLREAREAAKSGTPEKRADTAPTRGSSGDGSAGRAGLLDAILDVTQPSGEAPPPGTPEEIEAFVRQVVRPHLVRDDSDTRARIAAVDEAASLHVSELLHQEAFQRLEAIWRSLVFLLSRVDTTGKVRVYLVHLPREEIEEDLSRNPDPLQSRLFDLLSTPQLGAPGRRWALVTGAYQFGVGDGEIGLLRSLATIARAADVPWISGVDPTGNRGDSGSSLEEWLSDPRESWQEFRKGPEAEWLGLTYPRFLLREPYGDATPHGRVFDFSERIGSVSHLLWGEGPFLPAALLSQGFAEGGWRFHAPGHLDLGGMPMGNLPGEAGVSHTSTERALSPGEARSLMDMGIMPLLAFPERAGVRVGGIHPAAGPDRSLRGWWKGRPDP